MLVQRSRDHRRAFNARSYSYAGKHTTKDERIKFHGLSEGKVSPYDIRQTCKLIVQVWYPSFLVRGILREHSRTQ